jgi:hypothetical protein
MEETKKLLQLEFEEFKSQINLKIEDFQLLPNKVVKEAPSLDQVD